MLRPVIFTIVRLQWCVSTLLFLSLVASLSFAQADVPAGSDTNIINNSSPESQEIAPASESPSSVKPSSEQSASQTQESIPAVISIEPIPEIRSLFLAGVFLSETLSETSGNTSQFLSLTRVVGTMNFLKIKRRSQTAIDYRGGGWFERLSGSGFRDYELQQLQAQERLVGQKTALVLADSLGDLPGGSFGSMWFGGASAYGLSSTSVVSNIAPDPGIAQFIGSNNFVAFGQGALTNISLAELTRSLTRRSSLSLAGAYGITDYFGNSQTFINSQQASALATYSYILSPKSETGVVYGYRSFHFPEKDAGDITTNVAQFDYSRILSWRLRVQAGVGPEFSRILTPIPIPFIGLTINVITHQLNVSAFGSISYRLRRGTASLIYDRLVTNGSGLFAGANSNIVQFSITHHLTHALEASVNAGFLSLNRIGQNVALIPGNSYQYGYIGAGIRRRVKQFTVLATYQFNDESINTTFCGNSQNCSPFVQRNVALVGITWHTRPRHLDSGSGGSRDSGDTGDSPQNDVNDPNDSNSYRPGVIPFSQSNSE